MTLRRLLPLALLALAFAVALGIRARALQDLEERTFLLSSGFPGTEIDRKDTQATVSAVLFHGFQCNRVMMIELGRYLAHAGIRVFLLDFPGHGASALRFNGDTVAEQADLAFKELTTTYQLSPAATAVIGHSFGSTAVIKVTALEPAVFSGVLIGPGYYGGASIENPRDLLVLTGERDHRHILEASRRLLSDATAGRVTDLNQPDGHPPFRRLWKSVAATGHLALLYNRVTFDETLAWIDRGGHPIGVPKAGRSFLLESGAAAGIGLVLFIATFLLTAPRRESRPAPAAHSIEILLPFIATPLAAFWVRYLDPLARLRILEGSAIVSTLLLSGLITAALVYLGGRVESSGIDHSARPHSRLGISLRHLAIGAGYFCLLYAIAALTVSRDFYDLALKLVPQRVIAFLLFSVCSFALFSATGGILERLHDRFDQPKIRLAALVLTAGGLSIFLPLSLNLIGASLERFFAPMAVLLFFLFGLRLALLERSREGQPWPVFSALVVGWVTSVGFLLY